MKQSLPPIVNKAKLAKATENEYDSKLARRSRKFHHLNINWEETQEGVSGERSPKIDGKSIDYVQAYPKPIQVYDPRTKD